MLYRSRKNKLETGILKSIIDSLEIKTVKSKQDKSLRAALTHKPLKSAVENAGFVDSKKRDVTTACTMIGNTQRFLGRKIRAKNPTGRSRDD